MWWIVFYFLLALATYFDKISDTWAAIAVICSVAFGLFLSQEKRMEKLEKKVSELSDPERNRAC
jgi:hypothetical protein